MHPSWHLRSRYDDIGLIKLAEPIKFTEHIRPACLHHSDAKILDRLTVTGWGLTKFNSTAHSNLQKVHLNFVPHDECFKSYVIRSNTRTLDRGIDNVTHLCAGSMSGERDSCQVNVQIENYS